MKVESRKYDSLWQHQAHKGFDITKKKPWRKKRKERELAKDVLQKTQADSVDVTI